MKKQKQLEVPEALKKSRKFISWYNRENLSKLTEWCLQGYTYIDICRKLTIQPATFIRWRDHCPLIQKALDVYNEIADMNVVNALYRSATGYPTVETEVTFRITKDGKMVQTKVVELHKEVAPNVQATQTWLYNRLPQDWKRNRDGTMLEEGDDKIEITVVRAKNNY